MNNFFNSRFNLFALLGMIDDSVADTTGNNGNFQFFRLDNSNSFVIRCHDMEIINSAILPLCEYLDFSRNGNESELISDNYDSAYLILTESKPQRYTVQTVTLCNSTGENELNFDIENGITEDLNDLFLTKYYMICNYSAATLKHYDLESIKV